MEVPPVSHAQERDGPHISPNTSFPLEGSPYTHQEGQPSHVVWEASTIPTTTATTTTNTVASQLMTRRRGGWADETYEGDRDPTGKDRRGQRWLSDVMYYLRVIWTDRDSRRLFQYISLNFSFMFTELVVGLWTNSLGLISDSFHMLFDSLALAISLVAMILSRRSPTLSFSYGYDRFEVLAGFVNAVLLVFIAFFLLFEGVSRLVHPPHIDTERLLPVSIAGLFVNGVGILFFHQHHSHGACGHNHAHDENLHGVFLHILADTISSVGVIISSYFVRNWGYLWMDPLASLVIACLIVLSILPLLRGSASVLLQTTPLVLRETLDKALREASTVEGVLECRNVHFWTHAPGTHVGSFYARVRGDANEQTVLARIHNIFAGLVQHLTIQVEKTFPDFVR